MQRLWFFLTFGLIGAGILISLGVWQVQRLTWKQDLLAQIEAQIDAPALTLDAALTPAFQRYSPVAVTGVFGAAHVRMLASRKSVGPVYRIIRPFDTDAGQRILVDTGWQAQSAPVRAVAATPVTLSGNLDAPIEADGFTPAPDLDANIWFARDVPALADTLETAPVLLVLREAPEIDLGVTPWPVDTAGIPNDHLQYAITWFSLAAIWMAMTTYFVRRPMRRPDQKD
ncbi:MAG: SURF1 family protein [Pseudomonadota bacterium]